MDVEQPDERTLDLREEELVVQRTMREVGEARIRTRVEEVPARLEVEANAEEVEVEHVPVGQFVSERRQPWEEDGTLVVPIYEEQLVVSRRLLLKEQIRVRRVAGSRRELFEDTLRRERLVVEDPAQTGLVHEVYPTDAQGQTEERGGLMENLVRKALQ